jgi:two-component system, OmpR family, sensor kinase
LTDLRHHSRIAWRQYAVEAWWWVFVLVNTGSILVFRDWPTVPFHFIWISLALVYGWRVWSVRATAVVLALIIVLTGTVMLVDVLSGDQAVDELTEIPLMSAVFVVMVWFVRRAVASQNEIERVSERNHALLLREQRFVQDASHMLRTPLTIAMGYAEVLQRTTKDTAVVADLQVVVDELQRLRRITNRLLSLARSDEADFVHPVDSSVEELVRLVHRRWATSCPAVHLGQVEDALVRIDRDRLIEALDELVGNAVAHTPSGTPIELSARAEGDHQVIAVADEGPGITEADAAVIFDRWTHISHGGHAGGAGLGLAIVKAIAEAHGGSVSLNRRPGGGGAFELRLPRSGADLPVPSDQLRGDGRETGRLMA